MISTSGRLHKISTLNGSSELLVEIFNASGLVSGLLTALCLRIKVHYLSSLLYLIAKKGRQRRFNKNELDLATVKDLCLDIQPYK